MRKQFKIGWFKMKGYPPDLDKHSLAAYKVKYYIEPLGIHLMRMISFYDLRDL